MRKLSGLTDVDFTPEMLTFTEGRASVNHWTTLVELLTTRYAVLFAHMELKTTEMDAIITPPISNYYNPSPTWKENLWKLFLSFAGSYTFICLKGLNSYSCGDDDVCCCVPKHQRCIFCTSHNRHWMMRILQFLLRNHHLWWWWWWRWFLSYRVKYETTQTYGR